MPYVTYFQQPFSSTNAIRREEKRAFVHDQPTTDPDADVAMDM
jgi:hypothetical protein